jgi:hypothetical protein
MPADGMSMIREVVRVSAVMHGCVRVSAMSPMPAAMSATSGEARRPRQQHQCDHRSEAGQLCEFHGHPPFFGLVVCRTDQKARFAGN